MSTSRITALPTRSRRQRASRRSELASAGAYDVPLSGIYPGTTYPGLSTERRDGSRSRPYIGTGDPTSWSGVCDAPYAPSRTAGGGRAFGVRHRDIGRPDPASVDMANANRRPADGGRRPTPSTTNPAHSPRCRQTTLAPKQRLSGTPITSAHTQALAIDQAAPRPAPHDASLGRSATRTKAVGGTLRELLVWSICDNCMRALRRLCEIHQFRRPRHVGSAAHPNTKTPATASTARGHDPRRITLHECPPG